MWGQPPPAVRPSEARLPPRSRPPPPLPPESPKKQIAKPPAQRPRTHLSQSLQAKSSHDSPPSCQLQNPCHSERSEEPAVCPKRRHSARLPRPEAQARATPAPAPRP